MFAFISKKICPLRNGRIDLEIIPETIVAEVKLNRKKIFFVLSYCHPNLSSAEYDEYVKSLEQLYERINKENPAVTILTGDFNARSPLFWEGDQRRKPEKDVFLAIFYYLTIWRNVLMNLLIFGMMAHNLV